MTISIDAEIVINRIQCQSWFLLIQNEKKKIVKKQSNTKKKKTRETSYLMMKHLTHSI